jgi:glycosyltransferase involved in cell wall biosynthesis
LRIALVAAQIAPIREPQIGGAQVIVADLARGLALRGHEVAVFAPRGSHIDGVEVVDTGVDAEELRPTLNRGGVATSDARATAAFRKVFRLVDEGAWDCVHNHAFDPPAIAASTTLKCAVLHTLHLPPDPLVAAAIADAVRTKPVVVAVSAVSAAQWGRITRIHAVVRNGIPVARIPWSQSTGDGFLFVGRLSPEKGGDIAVEIAARSATRLTVIGGAYDEAWAARLRASTDSPAVEFLAPMAREEAWLHMARAAALLAPSRWEEPFGLSAAEAQASGTPVIATRRGALPEIVRHGVTGFIVDDVGEAVAATSRVALIDRAACRRHAETDHDIAPMLAAYERLYEAAGSIRT